MIHVETVISVLELLNRVKDLGNELKKAKKELINILKSPVASISIADTCRVYVDVSHEIKCINGYIVVGPLHTQERYTVRNGAIDAAERRSFLYRISLNPMTMCDLVVLTLYEKYDSLVSRIVETCGEGYEVLKRVVDASREIVDGLYNIVLV